MMRKFTTSLNVQLFWHIRFKFTRSIAIFEFNIQNKYIKHFVNIGIINSKVSKYATDPFNSTRLKCKVNGNEIFNRSIKINIFLNIHNHVKNYVENIIYCK